jgi:hypothetical protein
MEDSHLAAHKRELEITKHISLAQLDPGALLELRETGQCRIHVPEVLFDMDFAGHYFRRAKSLRLTLPCVAGPYTNVSATLRLEGSLIRRQPDLNAALEQVTGLAQAAIATSSANQDGGMFELNFNDPRYLPFEGAGVVSTWQLELPMALRPFDYDTITDVLIHLSYTAREAQDGSAFKDEVNRQIASALNDLRQAIGESDVTLSRLISLRQEFAAGWTRFLSSAGQEGQQITLNLTKQHFPRYLDYLWAKNNDGTLEPQPITLSITALKVCLNPKGLMPADYGDIQINETSPESSSDIPGLLLFASVLGISRTEISNEAGAELTLTVSNGRLRPEDWKDMYVLLHYEIAT